MLNSGGRHIWAEGLSCKRDLMKEKQQGRKEEKERKEKGRKKRGRKKKKERKHNTVGI